MPWIVGARPLDVAGHPGAAPLFRRQEAATRHLAVFLPGRRYGCEMPLLYYTAELLDGRGADILALRYDFTHERLEDLDTFEGRLEAAADAAVRAGLAQRPYDRVTLVGKSLGTWASACLLARPDHPLRARAAVDVVWLTPSLRFDAAFARMRACRGASLSVVGEADEHHVLPVRERVAELAAHPGRRVMTIPGADHGLLVPGDPLASVAVLGDVLRAVQVHLDL